MLLIFRLFIPQFAQPKYYKTYIWGYFKVLVLHGSLLSFDCNGRTCDQVKQAQPQPQPQPQPHHCIYIYTYWYIYSIYFSVYLSTHLPFIKVLTLSLHNNEYAHNHSRSRTQSDVFLAVSICKFVGIPGIMGLTTTITTLLLMPVLSSSEGGSRTCRFLCQRMV